MADAQSSQETDHGHVVDFAKTLAGVTALTAGLAAIATATGAFDRMQRNYPAWSAAAFSAAVAAGSLGVAATLFRTTTKSPRWLPTLRTALIASALALFLYAAVSAFVFEVRAQSDRPRPSITAGIDTQPSLDVTGTVKVEAMSSGDSLQVQVGGVLPDPSSPNDYGPEEILYQSRIGADGDGKLQLPLRVALPANRFRWISIVAWVDEKPENCFERSFNFKKAPGCVLIRIPHPT